MELNDVARVFRYYDRYAYSLHLSNFNLTLAGTLCIVFVDAWFSVLTGNYQVSPIGAPKAALYRAALVFVMLHMAVAAVPVLAGKVDNPDGWWQQ